MRKVCGANLLKHPNLFGCFSRLRDKGFLLKSDLSGGLNPCFSINPKLGLFSQIVQNEQNQANPGLLI